MNEDNLDFYDNLKIFSCLAQEKYYASTRKILQSQSSATISEFINIITGFPYCTKNMQITNKNKELYCQYVGSGSALHEVSWICIRIRMEDPDPGGKNTVRWEPTLFNCLEQK